MPVAAETQMPLETRITAKLLKKNPGCDNSLARWPIGLAESSVLGRGFISDRARDNEYNMEMARILLTRSAKIFIWSNLSLLEYQLNAHGAITYHSFWRTAQLDTNLKWEKNQGAGDSPLIERPQRHGKGSDAP